MFEFKAGMPGSVASGRVTEKEQKKEGGGAVSLS